MGTLGLLDRVIDWFAPPKLNLPFAAAKHSPVTPSKEWEEANDWHADWHRQMLDMEMALYRARLRHEAEAARDARRNSMIGRLDDCRWRVSVLMASKKLPADYAMRLR